MRKILGVALLATTAFVIMVGSPSIFGLLANAITLTSVGSVKTVGVEAYWDTGGKNKVSSIDWGAIEPGSTKNVIIHLKNEGNAPITLSLNATKWNPSSASNYITLKWDYSPGQQINPGNIVQVTLMLTVSSSVSGISSFTFEIIITGTG